MSDITAVVLTIGETITQRAIDSLNQQTLLPKDIIIVRNVSPFHKALNQGAAQVKTTFFVQVDSDMILNPDCLAVLRSLMSDNVGITVGALRDPLIGRVIGIKLFRTACFENIAFTDSISPDTDFVAQIAHNGWRTLYAHDFIPKSQPMTYTLGEHRPNYTSLYTFRKYILEGRRYRHRNVPRQFKERLQALEHSTHETALIAQIGMAHGLFLPDDTDLLKPFSKDVTFDRLNKFLESSAIYPMDIESFIESIHTTPKKAFIDNYKLGVTLHEKGASTTFHQCVEQLTASKYKLAWVAKVGLYQGLFSHQIMFNKVRQDWDVFKEFTENNNPNDKFRKLVLQPITSLLMAMHWLGRFSTRR